MKFSYNGPLSGDVPVVNAVENYSSLLATLPMTPISASLERLMVMGAGVFYTPITDKTLFTPEMLKTYFHLRILGNVKAYVKVLSEYILTRLDMLNNIPQTRHSMEVDTTKVVKYYYNLSRHSAAIIEECYSRTLRGHLNLEDVYNLTSHIELETISVYGQMGMVSPNPRCDDTVKRLLTVVTPNVLSLLNPAGNFIADCNRILRMYINITRLYYGAVNILDRRSAELGYIPNNIMNLDGEPFRISDSVVACLPAPTTRLLQGFYDDKSSVISSKACDYIASLDNTFLRRS